MARVLQGRGRSAPGQQPVSGLGLALLLPVVALGWKSGEPLTRTRPISARGGTTTSMGASKADEYIAAYRASDIPSGKKSELGVSPVERPLVTKPRPALAPAGAYDSRAVRGSL